MRRLGTESQVTPEDVRQQVDALRANHGDYEGAHGDEDRLYADVLRAISAGTCTDPAACATEALKTADIDFPRYRA